MHPMAHFIVVNVASAHVLYGSIYENTLSCLDPPLSSHVTCYTMLFYVEILLLRLMMIGDDSRCLAKVTVHYSFFNCRHLGRIVCLCKTAVNNVNNEMNGTEWGEVGNDKRRRNEGTFQLMLSTINLV